MKLTSFVSLLLLTTTASTEDEPGPKKEGIKLGKVKPPVAKTPKTVIEDVDEEGLHQILDEHEHVAVLFYSSLDRLTKKYILEMEQMDSESLDIEIVRLDIYFK